MGRSGGVAFENPARLARLTHGQAWSGIAVPSGGEVLRLAVTAPLLAGPAVDVGFTRRAGTYPRQRVHLGAAQQLPRGLAAGGALTLQAQSEADAVRTTFGLDLGLHWQPRARFEPAVS